MQQARYTQGGQLQHNMCAADDHGSTNLQSLDMEALALILGRLSAVDVARVGLTCSQLERSVLKGHQAAQLWRSYCQDLLGDIIVSYVESAGSAARQASTWHQLYTSARSLDAVHWSAGAPTPDSLYLIGSEVYESCGEAQLARYGHTATAVGSLLVLVGGMLRDGAHAATDVSVLDMIGRRVFQPSLAGTPPSALRHLCTALVALQPGSSLHHQIEEAIHTAQPTDNNCSQAVWQQQQQQQDSSSGDVACSGHTLLLFGGLAPDDSESGGKQLHALWLAADVSWGAWVLLETTGHAPAPRAYACCQPAHNGCTMIVYGGWANGSIQGTIDADVSAVDGCLLLCIYMLDVNNLHWNRQPTWPLNEPPQPGHAMAGPSTCPGPRRQALCSSRKSPVTGFEEFVVLGGCGSDGLADCVPHALCLDSFTWKKGPTMGFLPTSRDATALMKLSSEWLLLVGGKGSQGELVTDVQRLHLPSLSWKPPLHIYSNGDGAAIHQPGNETIDFSAVSGVVVGGCREGPHGLLIVPRLEILLPGRPIVFDAKAAAAEAAAASADSAFFSRQQFSSSSSNKVAALSGSSPAALLPPSLQQQPRQGLPGWMANSEGAGASCSCGSCRMCLARDAAAASCWTPLTGYPGIAQHQGPRSPTDGLAAGVFDSPSGTKAAASCGMDVAACQTAILHPVDAARATSSAVSRGGSSFALNGASKQAGQSTSAMGKKQISNRRPTGQHSTQPSFREAQSKALLQLLAAVAVVLLGLLLAYPSMMLQTAELGELGV